MNYRVIKEDDLFLLTDETGDIPLDHPYGPGLYSKDTRFLNEFELRINNEKPILLSSQAEESYYAEMLLTNPHMEKDNEVELWRESIEIKRKRFIFDKVLYESIQVKNYNPQSASFDISVHMDADFKDMFIVRGFQNGKTGSKNEPVIDDSGMKLSYEGADQVSRALSVRWDKTPHATSAKGDVSFKFELEHEEEETVIFTMKPTVGDESAEVLDKDEAFSRLMASYQDWETSTTSVTTDNKQFQRLIDRGLLDMRVLLTDLGYGKFPVAGLPWFGVPFGRDSLIAALQMLPFQPDIAKGTLRTMASEQGTKKDSWRDEEPGKIMHEMRFGELAATGQIPFTPYYGTIDATPLFLVLLGEYLHWTGDMELFTELESNVTAALDWIDNYGDRDGDGFVEYHQEAAKGIANQGWKDSGDSMVHRNGELGETPIALSEVQGYVYQAKKSIAAIYESKNEQAKAAQLHEEAAALKQKFEAAFWMEEQQFYALALDKEKEQVGTITSNPGHVLLSGMLTKEKAVKVSDMLLSDKMYSGYGIRTMGSGEAGYNPISYHNGTVWPHDNSMIILGMSKSGNQQQAARAMKGLISSADSFEYDRLPELFCGYEARGKAVKYPVACSPQAWAAGTPLLFVQSMLGIFPNAFEQTIALNPVLPDDVHHVKIERMRIGVGELSLLVTREEGTHQIEVLTNTSGFEIISKTMIIKDKTSL